MKAILVVDIPNEFANREPYFVEGSLFCYVKTNYGKYRYVCDLDKTKLKPLPKKKSISLKEAIGIKCSCYSDGFNDCIDEILGEQK